METAINYIISLFKNLVSWLDKLWEAFKTWVVDVVYNCFDAVLGFFSGLIQGIPVPTSWVNGSSVWSHFGADVIYIVNALHIPLAITIILAAWGVRMLMNLIPGAISRV